MPVVQSAHLTAAGNYQNLFVAKLPLSVTDAELMTIFAPYAPASATVMLDAVSGRSKGYAFVLFSSEADGRRAAAELDKTAGTVLRPAPIAAAGESTNGSSNAPLAPPAAAGDAALLPFSFDLSLFASKHSGHDVAAENECLYIRNIPNTWPMAQVEAFIAQHGKPVYSAVRSDHLGSPVWVVFVEYDSVESARRTLKAVHGATVAPRGPPILAKYAESEDVKRNRRERRTGRRNGLHSQSRGFGAASDRLTSTPHPNANGEAVADSEKAVTGDAAVTAPPAPAGDREVGTNSGSNVPTSEESHGRSRIEPSLQMQHPYHAVHFDGEGGRTPVVLAAAADAPAPGTSSAGANGAARTSSSGQRPAVASDEKEAAEDADDTPASMPALTAADAAAAADATAVDSNDAEVDGADGPALFASDGRVRSNHRTHHYGGGGGGYSPSSIAAQHRYGGRHLHSVGRPSAGHMSALVAFDSPHYPHPFPIPLPRSRQLALLAAAEEAKKAKASAEEGGAEVNAEDASATTAADGGVNALLSLASAVVPHHTFATANGIGSSILAPPPLASAIIPRPLPLPNQQRPSTLRASAAPFVKALYGDFSTDSPNPSASAAAEEEHVAAWASASAICEEAHQQQTASASEGCSHRRLNSYGLLGGLAGAMYSEGSITDILSSSAAPSSPAHNYAPYHHTRTNTLEEGQASCGGGSALLSHQQLRTASLLGSGFIVLTTGGGSAPGSPSAHSGRHSSSASASSAEGSLGHTAKDHHSEPTRFRYNPYVRV